MQHHLYSLGSILIRHFPKYSFCKKLKINVFCTNYVYKYLPLQIFLRAAYFQIMLDLNQLLRWLLTILL